MKSAFNADEGLIIVVGSFCQLSFDDDIIHENEYLFNQNLHRTVTKTV